MNTRKLYAVFGAIVIAISEAMGEEELPRIYPPPEGEETGEIIRDRVGDPPKKAPSIYGRTDAKPIIVSGKKNFFEAVDEAADIIPHSPHIHSDKEVDWLSIELLGQSGAGPFPEGAFYTVTLYPEIVRSSIQSGSPSNIPRTIENPQISVRKVGDRIYRSGEGAVHLWERLMNSEVQMIGQEANLEKLEKDLVDILHVQISQAQTIVGGLK